ncbi:MYXO-CTERM sorting domain-containing protein, partial [Myxococcota bacterium]|nr:MYXO-CTERM sorting domain-containing protein [Myxococcota bacterium]
TLVGALLARLGPASPAGLGVRPGESFSALQLELATRGERVTVDRATITLDGTADDARALRGAKLWRDLDGDGAVGDADVPAGSTTPDGDDGVLVFDSLGLVIPPDAAVRVVVELELADDAALGGTLRASLAANEDVRANGETTGVVDAVGAPIEGSAFTIVRRTTPTGPAQPVEGCSCAAVDGTPARTWEAGLAVAALALLVRRRRRT